MKDLPTLWVKFKKISRILSFLRFSPAFHQGGYLKYCGGVFSNVGGYFEYRGRCSRMWGISSVPQRIDSTPHFS